VEYVLLFWNGCQRPELDRGWTEVGQRLDRGWAEVGQRLDRGWTSIRQKLDGYKSFGRENGEVKAIEHRGIE